MNKLLFNYSDISTYRSELMGWAIIWIMMLHFTFNQIKPLGFIAQYGFAGVEIFLFVSGFGLYFSLDNDNSTICFYKKRLIRIFPTYYLIGFFASLFIFHDNIPTYLFRYTTIGFWTRSPYWEWYIPSLVILYIMSPFIKAMIEKHINILLSLIIPGILGIAFLFIDRESIIDREHFFFLYRIPSFIFGMLCAYWMKKKNSNILFLSILLFSIPFFILLYPYHHQVYNYKYFSLIFLLPSFIISFLLISKCIKPINPIISTIGNASLEIYLIQGLFFSAIIQGLIIVDAKWHDMVSILLILASSIMGIFVHWLIHHFRVIYNHLG